jgi:hypothetical protein
MIFPEIKSLQETDRIDKKG